jgi:hypothetical protein
MLASDDDHRPRPFPEQPDRIPQLGLVPRTAVAKKTVLRKWPDRAIAFVETLPEK